MKILLSSLIAVLAFSTSAAAQTWKRLEGQHSGVTQNRAVVVRCQKDWNRLWSEHDASAPAPEVDFSKESVVAVFGGRVPTAGVRIVIVVQQDPIDSSRLNVFYREERGSRGFSAQVESEPFAIVKVPRAATIEVERDARVSIPEGGAAPAVRFDGRKMKALLGGLSDPSFDGN
jgi:hypothetical protein